ncbi:MAG: hypothetical protein PHH00_00740 [Candidatus Nanoarchaeia archaeon]|nr:hypothetical protein [Candidatus Nanoarchaeia archaeon]
MSLIRKLAVPIAAGAISLFSILGCKQPIEPAPEPGPRNLELTILYSGHVNPMPFEEHNVEINLYTYTDDWEGEFVDRKVFSAGLSDLSSGHVVEFPNLEPGNYQLFANWDWSNDGVPDQEEPRSEPYPLVFEMKGLEDLAFKVYIRDQTDADDLGRVEGYVDLGQYSDYIDEKPIFVQVLNLNYEVLSEWTNYFPDEGILFPVSLYNCTHVPAGGPYYAVSFLDMDFSGDYNSGDIVSNYYDTVFNVSPGLPTVGIDINFD